MMLVVVGKTRLNELYPLPQHQNSQVPEHQRSSESRTPEIEENCIIAMNTNKDLLYKKLQQLRDLTSQTSGYQKKKKLFNFLINIFMILKDKPFRLSNFKKTLGNQVV